MSEELQRLIQVQDTRITVLEITMKGVEKNLESINNNLSRLVWLAITAIIGGIMAFIMRGGLML